MAEEKKGKYWYHTTIWYCVQCGDETKYRERHYTPKPEKWEDRYEMKYEVCDGCWYSMKLVFG
jgi:hypothetical protein